MVFEDDDYHYSHNNKLNHDRNLLVMLHYSNAIFYESEFFAIMKDIHLYNHTKDNMKSITFEYGDKNSQIIMRDKTGNYISIVKTRDIVSIRNPFSICLNSEIYIHDYN